MAIETLNSWEGCYRTWNSITLLKPKCLTDSSILKTDATAPTALAALAESISCVLYVCVFRAIEMHLIWFRNPEYLVDFFSGVQLMHIRITLYSNVASWNSVELPESPFPVCKAEKSLF